MSRLSSGINAQVMQMWSLFDIWFRSVCDDLKFGYTQVIVGNKPPELRA